MYTVGYTQFIRITLFKVGNVVEGVAVASLPGVVGEVNVVGPGNEHDNAENEQVLSEYCTQNKTKLINKNNNKTYQKA